MGLKTKKGEGLKLSSSPFFYGWTDAEADAVPMMMLSVWATPEPWTGIPLGWFQA